MVYAHLGEFTTAPGWIQSLGRAGADGWPYSEGVGDFGRGICPLLCKVHNNQNQ